MKKRQKTIGLCIIVSASILLTWRSMTDYDSRNITGSWNLDFDNTYLYPDSVSLEFLNGWTIIHEDGSVDLPPSYVPNRKIQNTLNLSKGIGSIDKESDSIIISAPDILFMENICVENLGSRTEGGHGIYFIYRTALTRLFYIDNTGVRL